MLCDCLKFNEEKLKEHYVKSGVVNPQVTAEFLGINLDTGEGTLHLVYTIHGDNKPYNTKKGKTCNMIASYCPFCGKPTK